MVDCTDILAVCKGKSLIVSVLQIYNCFSYFIQAYAYVLSNARFVKLEIKFEIWHLTFSRHHHQHQQF